MIHIATFLGFGLLDEVRMEVNLEKCMFHSDKSYYALVFSHIWRPTSPSRTRMNEGEHVGHAHLHLHH